MNNAQKTKWFFIGLASGWFLIFLGFITILTIYNRGEDTDPFSDVRPDIGKRIQHSFRPSTGSASVKKLGSTPFNAIVGPRRYTDTNHKKWDFYIVSVEKQHGDSSYVFYERQFSMEEIPPDIVDKTAGEIVEFDEETKSVTFLLGTSKYKYILPNTTSD